MYSIIHELQCPKSGDTMHYCSAPFKTMWAEPATFNVRPWPTLPGRMCSFSQLSKKNLTIPAGRKVTPCSGAICAFIPHMHASITNMINSLNDHLGWYRNLWSEHELYGLSSQQKQVLSIMASSTACHTANLPVFAAHVADLGRDRVQEDSFHHEAESDWGCCSCMIW